MRPLAATDVWPGFLAPAGAWLFLLFVPLILVYFLKLKRPRLEVPALALWRQVMNDRRVNSPFQRFKRSLLLLFQMLALLGLVLAVMQPYLGLGARRARYVPILIDISASMGAVDRPGGETRLEAVQREVRKLIDGLLPEQQLMLIGFHETAHQATEFSNNKKLLREALDRLTVADVAGRIDEALRVTHALARTYTLDSVLVFTDGNLPGQVEFDLPFAIQLQTVPAGGPNVGITALNARRAGRETWDLFVRVETGVAGGPSAKLFVKKGQEVLGEEFVALDPQSSRRFVFRVEAGSAMSVEAALVPEGFDALAADNVGWLELGEPRPLRAYVAPELDAFRLALRANRDVAMFPTEGGDAGEPPYDLAVTDSLSDVFAADGGEPARLAAVSLTVGLIPPDLEPLLVLEEKLASVVDWQRNDALLQHVNLRDVQIATTPTARGEAADVDFEQKGYSVLAVGRTGPLMLRRRDEDRLLYHLLFPPEQSTLPYRIGFPILVSNLVQLAEQQSSLREVQALRTGVMPARPVASAGTWRIEPPRGAARDVTTDGAGMLAGVFAPAVGRYRMSHGRDQFTTGAALLSPEETSLRTVEELRFPEASVSAETETVRADRPLWPLAAAAAFGCLLVEWRLFHRRPV